mgnify:CR=1 FL=1
MDLEEESVSQSYQPQPPRSLPVASHSGALVTVNHYCVCMGGADDLAQ